MDTPSSTPIAPHLEPVLRRLRQRIRRILSSRGALITTVTALAVVLTSEWWLRRNAGLP